MTGLPATSRVLVTGAGSQLASALAERFRDMDLRLARRTDLDITDAAGVSRAIGALAPSVVLNCAAYNLVDAAETEPTAALVVNAFGVRTLARAAAEAGAALVHYSTDFVFDGATTRPYVESDPPNPHSVYAASKLLGEWFALEHPRGFVLRVASLFGGSPPKGSVDRIVSAIIDGREARVFTDRTMSPSYVVDVAAATRALIERGEPGLYHCVNSGSCTWHELALEAARLLGRADDARLIPTRVADVPLRASRPVFAALSNARLAAVAPIPTWQDGLRRYIEARRTRDDGR